MGLGANGVPLLTAMITSAAAIWALSFVAYSFIFNYLDRWVKEKEKHNPGWSPDARARKSLRDNETVFVVFIVSGALSFGTIATAAAALIFVDGPWAYQAVAFYVSTLVIFAGLFVNEIRTSLRYVRERLDRPPS